MKRVRGISPEAQGLLRASSRPGNVRELRNTMERVVLLEDEELVLPRHLHFLTPEMAGVPPSDSALAFLSELPEEELPLEEAERMIIQKAYEKCGRNKSKTARYLRIPRHVLVYRMKKYGLEDT